MYCNLIMFNFYFKERRKKMNEILYFFIFLKSSYKFKKNLMFEMYNSMGNVFF